MKLKNKDNQKQKQKSSGERLLVALAKAAAPLVRSATDVAADSLLVLLLRAPGEHVATELATKLARAHCHARRRHRRNRCNVPLSQRR